MTTDTLTRPDDERLLRLWRKSCDIAAARRAIPDDLAHDHVVGPLTDLECEMHEKMLDVPAASILGVLMKLRAAARFGKFDGDGDLADSLVASALRDAERLAGEEGWGETAT